ncbi:HAMP domain-containing sensor histidine kinase [Dinoroseobacter sp. PD6]|uniref:sensor histidine kinase n=1 Tax=Dinoroseobacter sp. PD6 TaxID=3028384 RepID=UPI00237AE9ED|nr:HAMP domain-containing sensor histidine kinase [Dinoroseobacter sp. PD6]MDD9718876.1 HAMP domain-containing sensor histidine kinase [Dinoroseobacter sp. PD6]
MLAEVLIFVPSVARFREDYLLDRLERAQIASLALLATPDDMVAPELEAELLANAEVFNVVLRRDEVRQLILSRPMPPEIYGTYDLRDPSAYELIRDALWNIVMTEDQVIRVIGNPVRGAGEVIEITMPTGPLRAALIDYGIRILILSAVISIFTAALLFLAVRRFLVKPMRRVVDHMTAYAEAPEDARRIIIPDAGVRELRDAEAALQSLQTQLTTALKQKDRLAQLGSAVAKISHDLRNVLTVAQLLADRMERSEDPTVQKAAPKLVRSISRAVNLCEGTLAFGKAEELPPTLSRFNLAPLIDDVLDSEALACDPSEIVLRAEIPPGLMIRADSEQLYRVITNLVRNARQAIEATGQPGEICVAAREEDAEWVVCIRDSGPGLPPKARDNLFTAFQGGVRKGGTGLGLVIAAELVRGHGGALDLVRSDESGTEFALRLPRNSAILDAAAE